MGDPKGFMKVDRREPGYRPLEERITDYKEVEKWLSDKKLQKQASRCMDCGIPFCHGTGCPLGNLIPEWNDLVYQDRWEEALDTLRATNNFPEFTGRICPAPCEASCTMGATDDPAVAIRQIEKNLSEKGYENGWTIPSIPTKRTGKRVAIIGSGPAGLTVADQLNQMGHEVVVFEKDNNVGGYLRYGIPDFKLDKQVIERRVELMEKEGITFETGVNVGQDIMASYMLKKFDAIAVTIGARQARDLPIEGRDLDGVHYAMEFLGQNNKRVSGEQFTDKEIFVKDAKILVIGGGDTGSDCVGTSNRHGATQITQIEIMPKPPESRAESTPWPQWPYQLRTSSSHKEGCERMWDIMTKSFVGKNGKVVKANAVKVQWKEGENGRMMPVEIPGSEFEIDADYIFLAMGFTGPEKAGFLEQLGVEYDQRGNVKNDENGMTSVEGVFAAGDVVSGASLVVRAIAAGREIANGVNNYLSAK